MNEKNVAYVFNVVKFSHKDQNSGIFRKMIRIEEHHVKWNNKYWEKHEAYAFSHMRYLGEKWRTRDVF